MGNINKKAKNFLNKMKGFRIPGILQFIIDPCLIDPLICNRPEAQVCPPDV